MKEEFQPNLKSLKIRTTIERTTFKKEKFSDIKFRWSKECARVTIQHLHLYQTKIMQWGGGGLSFVIRGIINHELVFVHWICFWLHQWFGIKIFYIRRNMFLKEVASFFINYINSATSLWQKCWVYDFRCPALQNSRAFALQFLNLLAQRKPRNRY